MTPHRPCRVENHGLAHPLARLVVAVARRGVGALPGGVRRGALGRVQRVVVLPLPAHPPNLVVRAVNFFPERKGNGREKEKKCGGADVWSIWLVRVAPTIRSFSLASPKRSGGPSSLSLRRVRIAYFACDGSSFGCW